MVLPGYGVFFAIIATFIPVTSQRKRLIVHILIISFNMYCLFVCLRFIVSLENFSLIWKRHHCRWMVANVDLCLAPIVTEQWGFSNVPQSLQHGPTLYNIHLTNLAFRRIDTTMATKDQWPPFPFFWLFGVCLCKFLLHNTHILKLQC